MVRLITIFNLLVSNTRFVVTMTFSKWYQLLIISWVEVIWNETKKPIIQNSRVERMAIKHLKWFYKSLLVHLAITSYLQSYKNWRAGVIIHRNRLLYCNKCDKFTKKSWNFWNLIKLIISTDSAINNTPFELAFICLLDQIRNEMSAEVMSFKITTFFR